jgi:hypothetical protein
MRTIEDEEDADESSAATLDSRAAPAARANVNLVEIMMERVVNANVM